MNIAINRFCLFYHLPVSAVKSISRQKGANPGFLVSGLYHRLVARSSSRTVGIRRGSEPDPLDPRLKMQLEELVATMCKALNDPKRLMLIYALRERPCTVSELCGLLDIPQSNASQHLAVLRERGLLTTERLGNRILYHLRYPALIEAVDILRAVMSEELERQRHLHDLSAASGR